MLKIVRSLLKGQRPSNVFLKNVKKGNIAEVRLLLRMGVDLNVRTQEGCTALTLSIRHGHAEITRLLLNAGADMNVTDEHGHSLLMIAAQAGYIECIELLIEHGLEIRSEQGKAALICAAANKQTNCVRWLLEHGADVLDEEGITVLMMVCNLRNIHAVQTLLAANYKNVNARDRGGNTALMFALTSPYEGNTFLKLLDKMKQDENLSVIYEIVDALLTAGANINVQNDRQFSPLMLSIIEGYAALSERFILEGADVSATDLDNKRNALHFVALTAGYKGNISLIPLLLQKGANANVGDNMGNTSLMYAIHYLECCIALVNSGSQLNLDKRNKDGESALHFAVKSNAKKVVNYLILLEMDINAKDKEGITPLMLASSLSHNEILLALLKADADTSLKDKHGETSLYKAKKANNQKAIECLEHYQRQRSQTIGSVMQPVQRENYRSEISYSRQGLHIFYSNIVNDPRNNTLSHSGHVSQQRL